MFGEQELLSKVNAKDWLLRVFGNKSCFIFYVYNLQMECVTGDIKGGGGSRANVVYACTFTCFIVLLSHFIFPDTGFSR